MSEIVEKINTILDRYPCDGLSTVWKGCYSITSIVNPTIEDFENVCNNSYAHGIFGNTNEELCRTSLVLLAEAFGISGINNKESEGYLNSRSTLNKKTNDEILTKISKFLNIKIVFPSYNGKCLGCITTSYGKFTQRDCYYIYILKRIIDLCPDKNSPILEIGGGFGFLAYYLDLAGYKNYSCVDLPKASACQTYFCYKNLNHRNLILTDDVEDPFNKKYSESIKLLHYSNFTKVKKNMFSIVINTDSLSEMTEECAKSYINSNCSPIFLSINHESNDFRVYDIPKPNKKLVYRFPFWIRNYYVEELYAEIE